MKKTIIVLLLSVLWIGCGKKTEDSGSDRPARGPNQNEPPIRNISEFVKKHKITNEGQDAPSYLGRILVLNNGKVNFCAGVLINENTMLTSSQCFPRSMRIEGLNCAENVYALFGATAEHPREIVQCKKVLALDRNVSFLEPAMWKGEYLLFSLANNIKRNYIGVNTAGVNDNESLDAWSFNFVSRYESEVVKKKCRSLHNTYLNPFTSGNFAPMQVTSGCDFTVGSLGSPLVNKFNQLAGTVSLEMSGKIYNYLEGNDIVRGELGRYFHFSNISCLSFLNPNPVQKDECERQISLNRLDALRSRIIRGKLIHIDSMNEVELELEEPQKYFQWDIKFFSNRFQNRFEASFGRPKCIYNSREWIREFSRFGGRRIYTYGRIIVKQPKYIFKTKLNPFLRPISVLESGGEKVYTVEFNPFDAHVKGKTDVTITTTLLGSEHKKVYEGVGAVCPN